MTVELPDGPYFVPRYKPATGGVDFLGLRQVNLDLMALCLPGINNVTTHIRAFSLLSWIHWKFWQVATAEQLDHPSHSAYEVFLEKVETLFTWGHQARAIRGVPGILSRPPAAGPGGTSLSFRDWNRASENTSLMAAVQYGPASKTTGGLGFLEPLDGGFFRVCGHGVTLAECLDRRIRQRPAASLIEQLAIVLATEDDARDLMPAWRVDRPSPEEAKTFRLAFFQPERAGEDSAIGRRSGTLQLLLDLLGESDGMQEHEIRRAMAYLRTSSGRPVALKPRLVSSHLRWLIMQVRQAQRLAFESLLTWLEHRVLDHGDRDAQAIAISATKAVCDSGMATSPRDTIGAIRARCTGQRTDVASYRDRSWHEDSFDIFHLADQLAHFIESPTAEIVPVAFHVLLLTASAANSVEDSQVWRRDLQLGGASRVGIGYWRDTIDRLDDTPLSEFMVFFLENFILSQHFAVAAGRFDGTVQRLRLAIEEDGLTALVSKPWRPNVTPDRLASALSLSRESGLLAFDPEAENYSIK